MFLWIIKNTASNFIQLLSWNQTCSRSYTKVAPRCFLTHFRFFYFIQYWIIFISLCFNFKISIRFNWGFFWIWHQIQFLKLRLWLLMLSSLMISWFLLLYIFIYFSFIIHFNSITFTWIKIIIHYYCLIIIDIRFKILRLRSTFTLNRVW